MSAMKILMACTTIGLLGVSGTANGSIVSVSGAVQQIAPPSVVMQGISNTSTSDTATAWDEQQGVFLPGVPVGHVPRLRPAPPGPPPPQP